MSYDYIFDFERLDVYNKAIEFVNSAFKAVNRFSRGVQFSLGDQFRRAALSICNNIAEGSGKNTGGAKRQSYRIALDSARECIPVISIALAQSELSANEATKLREDCVVICRMLFKLISSVK